jgi:2-oxoglutarate ferredoxin oxidoreductase subunit alpha
MSVSHIHLKYLNPFPKNLGDILVKFDKILIPELNLGQLLFIIRAKFLIDAIGFNKVEGKPFTSSEIFKKIESVIKEK